MYTGAFPGCCTAKVVYGFGNSVVASHGPTDGWTEEKINKSLSDLEWSWKLSGMAVVMITLNSDQKKEDKLLRERGYIASRWISKSQHPQTKLRVYYKPLDR